MFFMFDIISLFCRLVNTFLAIYCEKVKSVLPTFKKTKRDSRGVCSTQALFKSLSLIIFHFHAVRNKRYTAA